jgi:SUZ domain
MEPSTAKDVQVIGSTVMATIDNSHTTWLEARTTKSAIKGVSDKASSNIQCHIDCDQPSGAVGRNATDTNPSTALDVDSRPTKSFTMVAKTGWSESNAANPSTSSLSEHNSKNVSSSSGAIESQSEVDSALLAGMRDPKERVALLRLEKALIDFMNSDLPWLEVGGPFNSLVLSHLTVNKMRRENTGASSVTAFPTPTLPSSFPEISPGQRQTSFQKCVLHRLADRFGIVREPGIMMPGSIRLFRRASSKIPIRLLKDLDPSEYLNNSNVYDSRQFYETSSAYYNRANGHDQQISSATRALANASLADAKDTVPAVSTNVAINPRKMKIMKRSDKPKALDGSSSSSNPKKFNRKNSSEISDKEKAYAEARARIFNNEDLSGQETDKPLAVTSNIDVGGSVISDVGGLDSNGTFPDEGRKPIFPPLQHQESSGSASQQTGQTETVPQTPVVAQGAVGSASTANLTGSTALESKAVYRNRVEEAADPDFRRHRTSGVVAPTTPMYSVGAVSAPTSLHVLPTGVSYGLNHAVGAWVPQTSSSFPVLQHPQPMQQAVPYYSGSRQQRHVQQQPQYHQIIPSYTYAQSQHSFPAQSFDNISSLPAAANVSNAVGPSVAATYQTQTNRNYGSDMTEPLLVGKRTKAAIRSTESCCSGILPFTHCRGQSNVIVGNRHWSR